MGLNTWTTVSRCYMGTIVNSCAEVFQSFCFSCSHQQEEISFLKKIAEGLRIHLLCVHLIHLLLKPLPSSKSHHKTFEGDISFIWVYKHINPHILNNCMTRVLAVLTQSKATHCKIPLFGNYQEVFQESRLSHRIILYQGVMKNMSNPPPCPHIPSQKCVTCT